MGAGQVPRIVQGELEGALTPIDMRKRRGTQAVEKMRRTQHQEGEGFVKEGEGLSQAR